MQAVHQHRDGRGDIDLWIAGGRVRVVNAIHLVSADLRDQPVNVDCHPVRVKSRPRYYIFIDEVSVFKLSTI